MSKTGAAFKPSGMIARPQMQIPARVMVVESVTHANLQTGEQEKIGWKVYCLTCWSPHPLHPSVFMLHQHDQAVALTRTHVCRKNSYGKASK